MICPNCLKEIKETKTICPFCEKSIKQEVVENWKGMIEQVVLGYEEHKGLVHGLQKDAIQNGWGHRLHKKGKDWVFEFNLFKGFDNTYILTMTDMGGWGLTGKNMETTEIPDDLPEGERLARFEHMFFSGSSAQAAGLFGRGKLLFTAASKDNHIIYDSLTHDGIYRLNERILKGRKFTNFAKAYEGEDAKGMLENLTKNCIKPLNKSGARIIIINPLDIFIKEIHSGQFLKYIEQTWWQIPLKYSSNGAKILIRTEKGTQTAKVPKEFKDIPKGISKKTGSKIYPLSFLYDGTELKVKRIHFIVSPKPVPPETRGIYVYRREMKVASLDLRDIPDEIEDKFYGYVEIEQNSKLEKIYLDEKVEGPEHYSLNKSRGVIRKLKKEVQLIFDKFKSEELGLGISSAKIAKEKTRRAMSEALNELNKRMGKLGISVGKISKTKVISISLESINFPHEENLVNIGDCIENIKFKIKNKADWDHKTKIVVFTKGLDGEIIDAFFEQIITLKSNADRIIGPFSLKMSADKYPKKGEIYCSCIVKEPSNDKTLAKRVIPIFIGEKPSAPIGPLVDLTLDRVSFPRGASNKRVNYGEFIKNIVYTANNNTAEEIKLKFKARILNALIKSEEIIEIGNMKEEICLKPFGEKQISCPNIKVTEEKFNILEREKGPVILRATLIALESSKKVKQAITIFEEKNNRKITPKEKRDIVTSLNSFDEGDRLAKNDLKFWVNMDSGKGVFEDYRDWAGGPLEPRSRIQPEGVGFVCYLNITHPAYENLLESGDAAARQSYSYEQLLRQTLILLMKKDMVENWPEIENKKYKSNIKDMESESHEKIEACLSTLDYLYADYLK